MTEENIQACKFINEARALRQKYFGGSCDCITESLGDDGVTFAFGKDGIVQLFHPGHPDESLCTVPTIDDFYVDYKRLVEIVSDGAMRSYAFQRLQLLSSAFKMHVTANGAVESKEQSNLLGTDFYRTMKIDNHIHAAAAPSAKQFVNFVRNKLETEANVEVCPGKTLAQVFEEAGLDSEHLTIDAFNVLADYSVYQRFDNFNSKYSPFRMADMRRIFLKTTNYMGGRYFAELIKLVLSRHEESKGHNSAAEMRLSIYGMERHEWLDLAKWVLHDWEGGDFPGPVLSSHNRWLIQVPRLWRIYRNKPGAEGERSFQEMLDNLFIPMFEATLYPEEHPEVAELLKNIVGIDSVDDEGTHEVNITCNCSMCASSVENDLTPFSTYRNLVSKNAPVNGQAKELRPIGGNYIIYGPTWRYSTSSELLAVSIHFLYGLMLARREIPCTWLGHIYCVLPSITVSILNIKSRFSIYTIWTK